GVLLFLDMVGAFLTVHVDKGLFVDKGGYELVLTLAAATLSLAAVGAGRTPPLRRAERVCDLR
ncbi:MAG: hypothetical protein ACJ72W_11505, partial [Actinoallomurus sp.]